MHALVRGTVLAAAVVTAGAACGKAHDRAEGPRPSGALEAEEILATKAGNMYDVIRLLRPNWLQRFGGRPTSLTGPAAEVMVYLDGQRYGEPRDLVRLSATSVRWAEYLTPSEAQARFGPGNLAGVIQIHTHGTGGR
jgi:hypothetical protein